MTNLLEQAINSNDGDHAARVNRCHMARKRVVKLLLPLCCGIHWRRPTIRGLISTFSHDDRRSHLALLSYCAE